MVNNGSPCVSGGKWACCQAINKTHRRAGLAVCPHITGLTRSSVSRPVFSTARLKRRMATSNGSFSFTRIAGILFPLINSVVSSAHNIDGKDRADGVVGFPYRCAFRRRDTRRDGNITS